ncbi:MAG: hypothetical protein WC974_08995 [Thermoplasmata archaeon]
MIGTLSKNKKENIVSAYMPSLEVLELIKNVKKDYATGVGIMQKSYEEFNDKTISERMNIDQKAFNSYSEPKSADPDRNWQWTGVKPITRNKLISIAAHITANILIPQVFAQNDADEEDKEVGEVMRSLIEWNIQNSDYDITFLGAVISALVNPAVIVSVEFAEVMQDIKTKNDAGEISVKEVVDEFFSGLQMHIVPCEELLINNIYEYHIQRQKCVIRRKYVDYDVVKGKYGDHNDFGLIKQGIRTFYSEEEGMFYDNKDEQHPTLCEEVIYYNRREDMEVPFVNGIYLGKGVKDNQFKHRRIINYDNEVILVPIYPFAKSGYELIDEKRFFYYKSAAFKLAPEQDLIDKIYRMVMDGTFMQTMPPIAGFGTGAIDSSVMYPGAFTPFAKDSKIEKIDAGAKLDWAYKAIETIEDSMSESSQSEVQGGTLPDPAQKAYTVAKAEQNAQIQLGLFGKMIGRLVIDVGYLMADIILNHQTVASIDEIGTMKYKTFLLPNQTKEGKQITKKMVFTDEFMGVKMTEEQLLKESFKLKKEGGDSEIYKINPDLFSRSKFLFSINADVQINKSDAFEKAWNLEALDRGINNPFINQEKWTEEHLVKVFHKSDSEKFMAKEQLGMPQNKTSKSTPINKLMESKVGLLG